MTEDHSTSDDHQIGTTRGGQPIESAPSVDDVTGAERASEEELTADREQIGTTRGGQPIEKLTHPESTD